jgi:hypothetical protein
MTPVGQVVADRGVPGNTVIPNDQAIGNKKARLRASLLADPVECA